MEHQASFLVKGMHCASCVAKVEKKIKADPGVLDASVNLLTEKATVKYTMGETDEKKIKAGIESLGYEVFEQEHVHAHAGEEEHHHADDIGLLKKRLAVGAVLSSIIFIASFPEWFGNLGVLNNPILLFVLATPVQFWVGLPFYRGAFNALKNRTTDMDTLIAVGTTAAYAYSTVAAFVPGFQGAASGMYFDTAAVIITLILLGRYLEAVSKGKASEAIKKLIGLQPKTALVVRAGKEQKIKIEDIKVGDIIIVKPGEKIPTDGLVLDGESTVDESMITGESIPVLKKKVLQVIGATIRSEE